MTPGTPPPKTGYPLPATRVPAPPSHADPDFAHRTRTNTRTPLEPIGYDCEGAPLWPWQLMDAD